MTGDPTRSRTSATTASPHTSSGRARTPASSTSAWASSTASTSAGATFSPPPPIAAAPQHRLVLGPRDVLAATDDRVGPAPDDPQAAVLVPRAEVAGTQHR